MKTLTFKTIESFTFILADLFNNYHVSRESSLILGDLNINTLLEHIWFNKIGNYKIGIILSDFTDQCSVIIRIRFKSLNHNNNISNKKN